MQLLVKCINIALVCIAQFQLVSEAENKNNYNYLFSKYVILLHDSLDIE
jgi:hypothetical protein